MGNTPFTVQAVCSAVLGIGQNAPDILQLLSGIHMRTQWGNIQFLGFATEALQYLKSSAMRINLYTCIPR